MNNPNPAVMTQVMRAAIGIGHSRRFEKSIRQQYGR
jgi:hypothetical protein